MKASLEISLYPLNSDYIPIIKKFIENINKNKKSLIVETNQMSTQIFGDYDELFDLLKNEFKFVFEQTPAVFVMKLIGKDLKDNS